MSRNAAVRARIDGATKAEANEILTALVRGVHRDCRLREAYCFPRFSSRHQTGSRRRA